jgi:hypothetical protein
MPAVFNMKGGFATHQAAEQLGRHSDSILFWKEKRYEEDFVVKVCGRVIACSRNPFHSINHGVQGRITGLPS